MNAPLLITFEREDGERYESELDYRAPITLITGECIEACQLTCGDEIQSHYSNETGGRGHVVIR